MYLNKNITSLLLTSTILIYSLESVENSIIPSIEKFEQIQNLPEKKFSKNEILKKISKEIRKSRGGN